MKCPTCRRGVNEGDDQCKRCGSDLTMLNELQQRITALLAEGYSSLKARDLAQSQRCFEEVLTIQRNCMDAEKGLALISLLGNNFASAATYYQRTLL